MGKQARQNRRSTARAGNPRREATPRDLDLRLWVIAGVAAVVVVGFVVVAFVASGAFASGGSGSLPPGTQTFAEPNHSHVPGTVTYDRVPPAGGRTTRLS